MGVSSFLAEATTLRDGIQLAWDHGHRNSLCEVDCFDLITVLSDVESIRLHIHASALQEVHELLNRNWTTNLSWIHKEGNSAAYWLAKEGATFRIPGLRVVASLPPELDFLLLKDSLSVP